MKNQEIVQKIQYEKLLDYKNELYVYTILFAMKGIFISLALNNYK